MNRILSAASHVRAELSRHIAAANSHTQRANQLQVALTALVGESHVMNSPSTTNGASQQHAPTTVRGGTLKRPATSEAMKRYWASLSPAKQRAITQKRVASRLANRSAK